MDPKALVEIESIKQLKARYFRLLDTKDWDAWEQVFTDDARLRWGAEPGQVMEGRAAIRAGVSASLEGAITVHHGHMPEIEIDTPQTAHGIWAMFDRVDHPAYLLVGHGHYHERYRKQDGAWRIADLELRRLHEDRRRKT